MSSYLLFYYLFHNYYAFVFIITLKLFVMHGIITAVIICYDKFIFCSYPDFWLSSLFILFFYGRKTSEVTHDLDMFTEKSCPMC